MSKNFIINRKWFNEFNQKLLSSSELELSFLIYHSYLKKHNFNNPFNKNHLIRSFVSTETTPFIENGLSLLGFGMINNKEYIDPVFYNSMLESITKTLIKYSDEKMNSNSMKDHELLYGLSGIYQFLLNSHNQRPKVMLYIENYIARVVEILNTTPLTLYVDYNQQNNYEKKLFKNGHFRFGLAHGIGGPLSFIALASQKGLMREIINPTLERYTRFYEEWKSYSDELGYFWPAKISLLEFEKRKKTNENMYPFSWCYGSVGNFLTRLNMALALKEHNLVEKITEEFICSIECNDYKSISTFKSPTICHGLGGVLLAIKKFGRVSNENDKIVSLFDKTMKGFLNYRNEEEQNFKIREIDTLNNRIYESNAKTSLLSGEISVYILLMSLLNDTEEDLVEKIFLIS